MRAHHLLLALPLMVLACDQASNLTEPREGPIAPPGPSLDKELADPLLDACSDAALAASEAGAVYSKLSGSVPSEVKKSDPDLAAPSIASSQDVLEDLETLHQEMLSSCLPPNVDGTWTLFPDLTLTCPDVFGISIGANLAELFVSRLSANEIQVSMPWTFELGFIDLPFPSVDIVVPYDPALRAFSALDIPFELSGSNSFGTATASGQLSIDWAFTGPDTFEAGLQASVDLTVDGGILGIDSVSCDDVNTNITGTRSS